MLYYSIHIAITNVQILRRIKQHGGAVVGGRVQGKLAVSRSFGDYIFKSSGVLVVDPGAL